MVYCVHGKFINQIFQVGKTKYSRGVKLHDLGEKPNLLISLLLINLVNSPLVLHEADQHLAEHSHYGVCCYEVSL